MSPLWLFVTSNITWLYSGVVPFSLNNDDNDNAAAGADAVVVCFCAAILVFVVSTITDNMSQVDRLWSILPMVYAWMAVRDARTLVMACLVTAWGIRLSYNFYRRGGYNWNEEDYRWSIIRDGSTSPMLKNPIIWCLLNIVYVSLYQNYLLLMLVSPSFLVTTTTTTQEQELHMGDVILAVLFLLFLGLESLADQQQFNFHKEKQEWKKKKKKKNNNNNNKNKTFDSDADSWKVEHFRRGFCQYGLFAYLRKPNYAAEQALWLVYSGFVWSSNNININNNNMHTTTNAIALLGALQLVALFQTTGPVTENISISKYHSPYKEYQSRVPLYVPKCFCWFLFPSNNNKETTTTTKSKEM